MKSSALKGLYLITSSLCVMVSVSLSVYAASEPLPSPLFEQSLRESVTRLDQDQFTSATSTADSARTSTQRPVVNAVVLETSDNSPTCALAATCDGFYTCAGQTCEQAPTCQRPTCYPQVSCPGGGWVPTMMCESATCSPNPTCNSGSTCPPNNTCNYLSTCKPNETCVSVTCTSTCSSYSTCGATCSQTCDGLATCGATCNEAATCPPNATCPGVSTCSQTCDGQATCGMSTCPDVSTCVTSSTCAMNTCDQTPTCLGIFSCPIPSPTMSCGGPTCSPQSTCVGATCPPDMTCIPVATCPASAQTCSGNTCGIAATCSESQTCPGAPTCDSEPGCTLCSCPKQGDLNGNGSYDIADLFGIIMRVYFEDRPARQDPNCPHSDRADLSCDGEHTIIDIVLWVDHVWREIPNAICDPCVHSGSH